MVTLTLSASSALGHSIADNLKHREPDEDAQDQHQDRSRNVH